MGVGRDQDRRASIGQRPNVVSAETDSSWEIRIGDAFELIRDLDQESVELTITSPPYNVGKAYEERVDFSRYLEPYAEFARLLFEKTSPTGSVCWEVGNYVESGEVFPLDIFFYQFFKEAGFRLRNRIVWHFEHGLHANRRLSGRYETILWFTKSDDYHFDLDPIRVPAKYPGKLAFKGKNKGKPTANPRGKNPSDYWKFVVTDWDSLIWNVPNVKANHPEKTSHPCQFPVELAERFVIALSKVDDLVFDPFLGVGSSAIAALLHRRAFLGFELDPEYSEVAAKRIELLRTGGLRLRPMGKPVFQPTGREKVAQRPPEWDSADVLQVSADGGRRSPAVVLDQLPIP